MANDAKKNWIVILKPAKKVMGANLPDHVLTRLDTLVQAMEESGPLAVGWKNFSAMKGKKNYFHCHLSGGSPTYVACWVSKSNSKEIEVIYVGTHKKAPY